MSDVIKSSDILTEHLGYAPLSVVDDVINAVNEVMYKCTTAMEAFLYDKYPEDASKESPNDQPVQTYATEIEVGTAKLETLLEAAVDRNFDKFELYVLRNVLTIPVDLISEGWLRLSHHQNIDFGGLNNSDFDQDIRNLRQQLSQLKHVNFILTNQQIRARRLLRIVQNYTSSVILDPTSGPKTFENILPLAKTITGLVSQIRDLQERIQIVKQAISTVPKSLPIAQREMYLETVSNRIIQGVNLEADDKDVDIAENLANKLNSHDNDNDN